MFIPLCVLDILTSKVLLHFCIELVRAIAVLELCALPSSRFLPITQSPYTLGIVFSEIRPLDVVDPFDFLCLGDCLHSRDGPPQLLLAIHVD